MAVLVVIALAVTSLARPSSEESLTIASMDFSENEILAYMMEEAIETKLGISVETIPDLGGSSVCLSSINSGEIDGYVEYTGTIYVSMLKKEPISDVDQVYEEAKAGMKEMYGLEVLPSLNVILTLFPPQKR